MSDAHIRWTLCRSYDDARDFTGVLYLHERDGQPLFWGKADKSAFGGNPRIIQGLKFSGRYPESYRHWVDACLSLGDRLYIGEIVGNESEDEQSQLKIAEICKFLLMAYPAMYNKPQESATYFDLRHTGYVPEVLAEKAKE
ncbi:hypothetical protein [Acidithiobacillus ferrivorans]|uniref:hypothetical protein n=1 Tax=Acidithiobacillus ferrivorans TaxID=160808 RepID=UPI0008DBF4CF|nr:hypothetical protein [Acidithiobacillus ferrivorans]